MFMFVFVFVCFGLVCGLCWLVFVCVYVYEYIRALASFNLHT